MGSCCRETGVCGAERYRSGCSYAGYHADQRQRTSTITPVVRSFKIKRNDCGRGRGQAREGIVDAHSLPDVPAGTYMLKIGMYDLVTQVRFAVSAAGGAVLSDVILSLGAIARP